jgi:hypothetical protein
MTNEIEELGSCEQELTWIIKIAKRTKGLRELEEEKMAQFSLTRCMHK